MISPIVSVITITYNRSSLISRCIQSVLEQTYNSFEHIIIDASTNNETEKVVNFYNDNRIKYYKVKENDIVANIMYGFVKSSGDYITFLDDDDQYLPSKIEKQVQLFNRLPENYGFVYCWMTYFDESTGEEIKTHKHFLKGFTGDDVVEYPTISGTPTYMFKRSVFEEFEGWKRKEEIGIISDWELAARVCQKYYVDYVPESLINIYINHGKKRMSDSNFYPDLLKRNIVFHKYFLSEFSDVFMRFPRKKYSHLYIISSSLMQLGMWKNGLKYYKELIETKINLKVLLLPLYCYIKSLKHVKK